MPEFWEKDLQRAKTATAPSERKATVALQGDVLGNVQKAQAIQKGAATLPFEAATAAAQLEALKLRNAELERQILKAEKGEALAGDDKTRLITDVDAYDKLMRAINKFDPDYVGTVLDFPGEVETFLQKRVSSDIGTPGQADFWSEMKFLDMLSRNKYFGASLAPAEKASYAETTISPGDTADTALANLKRRAETVRAGIQRNVRSLVEGGYRPAQVNAQLGQYLPDLNPRWLPADGERLLADYASQKDFDPKVYGQMMSKMAEASGIRLEPAQVKAAAKASLRPLKRRTSRHRPPQSKGRLVVVARRAVVATVLVGARPSAARRSISCPARSTSCAVLLKPLRTHSARPNQSVLWAARCSVRWASLISTRAAPTRSASTTPTSTAAWKASNRSWRPTPPASWPTLRWS
jgi:hypothetical protein